MKTTRFFSVSLVPALLFAGAVTLYSQDAKKPQQPAAPAAPEAPPTPKGGPEHELFSKTVGVWDATLKFRVDPSQPEILSKGVEKVRQSGPFWVVSDYEGDFMGTPFKGMSLNGYSQAKKEIYNYLDRQHVFRA